MEIRVEVYALRYVILEITLEIFHHFISEINW